MYRLKIVDDWGDTNYYNCDSRKTAIAYAKKEFNRFAKRDHSIHDILDEILDEIKNFEESDNDSINCDEWGIAPYEIKIITMKDCQ